VTLALAALASASCGGRPSPPVERSPSEVAVASLTHDGAPAPLVLALCPAPDGSTLVVGTFTGALRVEGRQVQPHHAGERYYSLVLDRAWQLASSRVLPLTPGPARAACGRDGAAAVVHGGNPPALALVSPRGELAWSRPLDSLRLAADAALGRDGAVSVLGIGETSLVLETYASGSDAGPSRRVEVGEDLSFPVRLAVDDTGGAGSMVAGRRRKPAGGSELVMLGFDAEGKARPAVVLDASPFDVGLVRGERRFVATLACGRAGCADAGPFASSTLVATLDDAGALRTETRPDVKLGLVAVLGPRLALAGQAPCGNGAEVRTPDGGALACTAGVLAVEGRDPERFEPSGAGGAALPLALGATRDATLVALLTSPGELRVRGEAHQASTSRTLLARLPLR
jgi:hypothetical protein